MQNMQNKDAWNLNKGEINRIYGLAQTQKIADITFCRNILNLVCVNRLWRELVVHLDSLDMLAKTFIKKWLVLVFHQEVCLTSPSSIRTC